MTQRTKFFEFWYYKPNWQLNHLATSGGFEEKMR